MKYQNDPKKNRRTTAQLELGLIDCRKPEPASPRKKKEMNEETRSQALSKEGQVEEEEAPRYENERQRDRAVRVEATLDAVIWPTRTWVSCQTSERPSRAVGQAQA